MTFFASSPPKRIKWLRSIDAQSGRIHHHIIWNDFGARKNCNKNIPYSSTAIPGWVVAFAYRFHRKSLWMLFRDLHCLMVGGFNLDVALGHLAELQTSIFLRSILSDVQAALIHGAKPSAAFARHESFFGFVTLSIIEAMQSDPSMTRGMAMIRDHHQTLLKIQSKVQRASRYPALLAIMVSVCIGVMLTCVMPHLNIIHDNISQRDSSSISTLSEYYLWIFICFGGLFVIFIAYLLSQRAQSSKCRKSFLLKTPVLGKLLINYDLARFFTIWSIFVQIGYDPVAALRRSAPSLRLYHHRGNLERAIDVIEKGTMLTSALRGILPPMASCLLQAGEMSHQLPTTLLNLQKMMNEIFETSLESFLSLIEPVLVMILGLILAAIVVLALYPLYDSFEGLGL